MTPRVLGWWTAAALAMLPATACSPAPVPADDLAIRIDSEEYEVPIGTPFPLTVERSWARNVAPEDWDDEVLAPLTVRATGVDLRESDTHALEIRTFVAVAPELGDVRVLPPLFVAQRESEELVATGEALDLRVLPVLSPADASDVELPGDMLRERAPWGALIGALGALAVVALLLVRARRRPAPAPEIRPEPGVPRPSPEEEALLALAQADALLADDDPRRLCDAVSLALRAYVSSRFGLGSSRSTTIELTRGARAAGIAHAETLADVLTRCDLVRFARLPLLPDERSDLVAAARGLVAPAGAATPAGDAT